MEKLDNFNYATEGDSRPQGVQCKPIRLVKNWFPKENNNSTLSNFLDYEQKPRKNDFDVFAFSFILWVGPARSARRE